LRERYQYEDINVDWMIVLKLILKKQEKRMWSGLNQLRIRKSGELW
jgi:hypothetical protein